MVINKKEKMKKLLFSVILMGIILSATFIIAENNVSQEVSDVLEDVAEGGIAQNTQEYVEDFVNQKGIDAEEIDKVEQVDLNDLPNDLEIENVDDTNLAIYKIAYENFNEELFVITYSTNELISYKNLIFKQEERQLLNFGVSQLSKNQFLETSTALPSGLNQGYVMMRDGSITGLSTSLEIEKVGDERIEVIIYVNDEPFHFRNYIDTSSVGKKTAFNLQSTGIVTFNQGDSISVYVSGANEISAKNVITMLEITTN